jgi:photosystem II stability/assembly factor-like uncharacterized protein
MKKNLQIIALFFFMFFSFQSNSYSQWFKLPDLPDSGKVFDMQFLNVNTGWITLLNNISSTCRLIKTTNGGQNWNILISQQVLIFNFFNDTFGIALNIGGNQISKSTNGGLNWNAIFTTGNVYQDIFFVSKDTGWVCGFDGMWGGVWRTNDGGNSWLRQYTASSSSLDRIFFLKNKVNGEYWGWTFKANILWRTTNSGNNWILINSNLGGNCQDGYDIYFIDTAKGIITRGLSCFSTTTNGGFNWTHHSEFASLNSRIGIGDNNKMWLTLGTEDSLIKTINFFQTYGKQVTAAYAGVIFALDTSNVYAGWNITNMMKTMNGGGPIIYTGIDSLNLNLPVYYKLYQNYPNPFNPATTIIFDVRNKSYVNLIIYDITGKEVLKLYNNNFLEVGTYKSVIDFGKMNLSSGVYLYRLSVMGTNSESIYMETRKMIYIR